MTAPSSIVTATVSVVSNHVGESELLFPTMGPKAAGVETTYVLTSSVAATITAAPTASTSVSGGLVPFTSGESQLSVAVLWVVFGGLVLARLGL